MNASRDSGRGGTVVVGVDGSEAAGNALRWAAAEARLRESRLLIVHAWSQAYMDVLLVGPLGGFSEAGGDMRRMAEMLLEKAAAEVDDESVEIESRLVEGGAPEVLVAAAAEADLLVVGSRGHGGFAGLLLGSVSQQCAHHAHCPVVIVPAPRPAASRLKPVDPPQGQTRAAA
jgi:nucleotide-binding universal stress UspA family protein